LSEETVRAAKNLDEIIGSLSAAFGEGTDYFTVLVNVFRTVLMNDAHSHLDNFYMIVPSLCLSWVEASLQAKDMMYKKNRNRDAYYTDDGFAMGIAYILSILNQNEKFEALHWFDSLRGKYEADQNELKVKQRQQAERMAVKAKKKKKKRGGYFSRAKKEDSSTDDEEDAVTTLQLTGKRLAEHQREVNFLFFSVRGASIFFHDKEKVNKGEGGEEKNNKEEEVKADGGDGPAGGGGGGGGRGEDNE